MCQRADGLPSVWGGDFELENSQDRERVWVPGRLLVTVHIECWELDSERLWCVRGRVWGEVLHILASLQDISMDHIGRQELGGPKFLDLMVTWNSLGTTLGLLISNFALNNTPEKQLLWSALHTSPPRKERLSHTSEAGHHVTSSVEVDVSWLLGKALPAAWRPAFRNHRFNEHFNRQGNWGWGITWLVSAIWQVAGRAELGPCWASLVQPVRTLSMCLTWTRRLPLAASSPAALFTSCHAGSGRRVGTQPRGMMTAPRGWQVFYFYTVAALYLASVEGHFCAYPEARTHQTLQRRCWLPLCEGAGRMGNQWTSDVKK